MAVTTRSGSDALRCRYDAHRRRGYSVSRKLPSTGRIGLIRYKALSSAVLPDSFFPTSAVSDRRLNSVESSMHL